MTQTMPQPYATLEGAACSRAHTRPALIHEADFYRGTADLLSRTVPFLREAAALGEPTLVMLQPPRAAALRAALGADADAIVFLDKSPRANPCTLIPTLRAFVAEQGRPWVRGIDEPLRPGARQAEITEAQLHERLLAEALSGTGGGLLLRCLYDTEVCGPRELVDAKSTHMATCGALPPEAAQAAAAPDEFAAALPPPPPRAHREPFAGARSVAWARRQVLVRARLAQLDPIRCSDLVLAVSELVTNSVTHGGGSGVLSIWQEEGYIVCDVHDRGPLGDPLTGRRTPSLTWCYGRGLWLVNSLCDLVQLRSSRAGTTARLHVALA